MQDFGQNTSTQWVVLGDGRRLSARLWMPEGVKSAPAILEYLPYRKRDGTAARDETTHSVFAKAGYACVRVDIAGTGDSEGSFDDEYSEQELSDGEEIIAWISAQPWCNGSIGIIGISWGGFNGLQLAYRQPNALKAVVSVASTADRYADDIHYMGGCLLSDNANWASQMFAYLSRPADPELRPDWREDWIARMENLPDLAAEWLSHPTRDAFWKHGSICEDFSKVQLPVLAITGWADSYVNTPSLLAKSLPNAKALVGPWEHRYAHISKLGAADFHSEVIGWFDRWMKNEQNGAEDLPAYRSFMQEHFNPTPQNKPREGRWISEENWPSENVQMQTLFFGANGLTNSAQPGETHVQTPAHVGQTSGYFCAGMRVDNELPGDQSADDALSICFDTNALPDALELLGRPVLKISFRVDQPTAQLMARLCDVSPEGVSQRISYRPLNLTHHASHETPEFLLPGEIYDAEIELNELSHRLRPGHRLRLGLSTSYWPILWPAAQATTVTLVTENSSLSLPVRRATDTGDTAHPGAADSFPTLQSEVLRDTASRVEQSQEDDGTIVLETFDDYGKSRDPGHGLESGSHVSLRYAIHPDDPLSASYASQWNFTYGRGDWQVEIDTETSMTCDADNFYLHRKIRATEGALKSEVLVKEWSQTMARGFL
ncbi:CocE/NonD family hydrolase [Halocynthiibacter namhaensis]|uniref:CocE/NonD family hydrolase n=1 Tax=Halocynthiibacter namhaensis TaxID=1290553 RepID=UPI0005797AF9|nr:CocE/NonD family hydrolase [Halocynthiibacter namhaensis]